MKRLLFLLIAGLVVLAGCGVHKNISEDMVADTEQVLEIFDNAIKDNRNFSEKEDGVLSSYYSYYESKLETDKLTHEEIILFADTSKLVENPEIYITLESDKERYKKYKERIKKIIKTGEI